MKIMKVQYTMLLLYSENTKNDAGSSVIRVRFDNDKNHNELSHQKLATDIHNYSIVVLFGFFFSLSLDFSNNFYCFKGWFKMQSFHILTGCLIM